MAITHADSFSFPCGHILCLNNAPFSRAKETAKGGNLLIMGCAIRHCPRVDSVNRSFPLPPAFALCQYSTHTVRHYCLHSSCHSWMIGAAFLYRIQRQGKRRSTCGWTCLPQLPPRQPLRALTGKDRPSLSSSLCPPFLFAV
jgi:hypothetical protein